MRGSSEIFQTGLEVVVVPSSARRRRGSVLGIATPPEKG